MIFAEKLKTLRKEKNISQEQNTTWTAQSELI